MKTTLTAIPLALLAAVPEPPAPQWPTLEPAHTWGLTVADWNGDGVSDVLMNNHRDGHHANPPLPDTHDLLLVSDGDTWRVELELPFRDRHGCTALHADANGLLDFFCAVGAEAGHGVGGNELWLQHPDGWTESAAAWGIDNPYGRGRFTATVDWDGDGDDDLFVGVEPRRDGRDVHAAIWLRRVGGFVEMPVNGHWGTHCAVPWRGGVVVCDSGDHVEQQGAFWLVQGQPPVDLGPYNDAAAAGDTLVLLAADHVLVDGERVDLPRPAREGMKPSLSTDGRSVYVLAGECNIFDATDDPADMILTQVDGAWRVADAPNTPGCTSTVAHLDDQVLVMNNGADSEAGLGLGRFTQVG